MKILTAVIIILLTFALLYSDQTDDLKFMEQYGAEILLDICKFWASKSELGQDGKYHIHKVMGPDEFHESLPGSGVGGLTDNAYSNIMVSWMMDKAFRTLDAIGAEQKNRILGELSLSEKELDLWKSIMHGVALHIADDGVVEQFKGYFGLEELDWEAYRQKYADIHRLDRILKSEGKSPDDYKLAKQADFLMSFYNLGTAEVKSTVEGLGYKLPEDFGKRNFDYYIERTSHGSTLSRLVHARLAWEMEMTDTGWELYMDALRSDLVDIPGSDAQMNHARSALWCYGEGLGGRQTLLSFSKRCKLLTPGSTRLALLCCQFG